MDLILDCTSIYIADWSSRLRFSSFLTEDSSVDIYCLDVNMDGKYLSVFLVAAREVRQYLPSFTNASFATKIEQHFSVTKMKLLHVYA